MTVTDRPPRDRRHGPGHQSELRGAASSGVERNRVVIGIDLGGTKVRAAVARADGRILAEHVERTRAGTQLVAQLADLARRLVEEAELAWATVHLITVGSPGVADHGGRMRLSGNVAGLDTINLAEALSEQAGCRVSVDNDATAAAVGEGWLGAAKGCDTFAALSVGTGIGLGLVVNGRVVRGARGAAGEIAYLPIGTDPATSAAVTYGAFELAAATRGIKAATEDGLAAHPGTVLDRGSSVREIFRAAAKGDTLAQAVVSAEARLLAHAVLAIYAIIDPELIVLTGGIGANPALLAPTRTELAAIEPYPLRVVQSTLGARSGVLGAIALALHDLSKTPHHP